MKRASLILLSVIIVAFVVFYFERPEKSNVQDFSPFKLYPDIKEGGVAKIEVEQLLEGSTLTAGAGGWKVAPLETAMAKEARDGTGEAQADAGSFGTDAKRVENMLARVLGLEAVAIASRNPSKQAAYQVTKIAKQIRLFDASGRMLANLYIGKNGPDVMTTYVRRDGENDVYLVNEPLSGYVPVEVMSWRDRKIWDVDPGMVSSVTIERTEKGKTSSIAIKRDEKGAWALMSPSVAELDGGKANELVTKASEIIAARFASPLDKEAENLENPPFKLGITTADGKAESLSIGGADKEGYLYARLDSRKDEIYLLKSDFTAAFPTDWTTLLPAAEPKAK